ncbi:MAG: type II secretion system GspH family protein [Lentisphaeraceae bacterium]|nr:type II secretion system GspH family protein [Lentisphaeraceae bacterium]
MKSRTLKKRHFSLIELLVVIGIIGILSAIILPAIAGSKEAAIRTKGAAQVRQIAMAIENYYSDYQTLPSASSAFTALEAAGNPRGKVYYDGPQENPDTSASDRTITISLDDNYDNQVSSPDGDISGKVAVYTTMFGKTIKSWDKN